MLGDLIEWANTAIRGEANWNERQPRAWDDDVTRFFDELQLLDAFLDSGEPLNCTAQELFQGPIADALTHVGQLATLRRVAGAPVLGEDYYIADISIDRVGRDPAAPKLEFD